MLSAPPSWPYRLSEDARILEFERVKLASRLKEAEDRAAWYQSQLEYHKQVCDTCVNTIATRTLTHGYPPTRRSRMR